MLTARLIYTGEMPVHTLGMTWSQNTEIDLQKIFSIFSTRCPVSDSPDLAFVQWFADAYVSRLSSSFEFIVEENDPIQRVEESEDLEYLTEVAEELEETDTGEVLVESSEPVVADSFEVAKEKLKKLRHPDAVGSVERNEPDPISNNKVKDLLEATPKLGTVMTGDDLAPSKKIQTSISSVVLNPKTMEGQVVSSVDPEVVALERNRMAEVNRGIKVLQPAADNSESVVVAGDVMTVDSGTKKSKAAIVNPAKRNVNFNPQPASGAVKPVSVDDIVRNSDPKQALALIKACKSTNVLKQARRVFSNSGRQDMIQAIEERLTNLPPVSM